MSEMWKKWEGQVVDHKYQLQRYVGSTDHSVVFLAGCPDAEPHQVAIKFVSADVAGKEQQLANWETASHLSHGDLLKIYGSGQCRIEDTDLLYVVMEYAEENLSQVLPHRPLVTEETREMLNAISEVLIYLHENNLVHGHIKPSNILASRETLKLSSDTISPAGEVHEMRRERSAYDAPELPGSPYTPAADTWSLGVTLVEALTQQPAFLPFNEQADPIVPSELREPFQEIARQTLRRDPRRRWSSEQIAEKLHPTRAAARSVAAGAGTTARAVASSASPVAVTTEPPPPAPAMSSPLTVPLSRERAVPLVKQPPPPPVRRAAPRASSSEEGVPPRETVVLPSYVIPVFAGLLVIIALIVLPFALRHRAPTQASSVNPASTASSPSPAVPSTATSAVTQPTPKPAPSNANVAPEKTAPAAAPTPAPTRPQPVTPATAPDTASDAKNLAPTAPKTFSGSKGEALDQVRPEAPAHALNTIHGTVRVRVEVHADPAGNVSNAVLDNAGPSRYFADLSLKAAKQWVFTPPEVDGHSVPSDWLIEFHYTSAGVQMSYEPLTAR
jgi:eukaryotic-like serine/threonine-protein kinase